MTSQASKALVVLAAELSIGDIVHGVNKTTWVHRYRVYEGPIESNSSTYIKYIVGRIGSGYEHERIPWDIGRHSEVMIENRMFKYDPQQAGDTDDDI